MAQINDAIVCLTSSPTATPAVTTAAPVGGNAYLTTSIANYESINSRVRSLLFSRPNELNADELASLLTIVLAACADLDATKADA